MKDFIKRLWWKIVMVFQSIEKPTLWRIILGMFLAAFLCIDLKVQACLFPMILISFIIEFLRVFNKFKDFEVHRFLDVLYGSAIIQLLAIFM